MPQASFYIEPSEPGIAAGGGNLTDTFTFSGDVTDAKCFELALKDGDSHLESFRSPQTKVAEDGKASFSHRFSEAKRYTAILKAYKQQDCDPGPLKRESNQVEFELDVVVRSPRVVQDAPPEFARFSVEPSSPSDSSQWRNFVFTANVSGATRYDLDFGDGDDSVQNTIRPEGSDKEIRRTYRYRNAGDYPAVLLAARNTGETVEIRQLVSVRRPPLPPAAAPTARIQPSQWPRIDASPRPQESEESDTLFLLLLLAGTLAALSLLHPGVPATEIVKFVPIADRGRSGPKPGDADGMASMLVWRSAARFSMSSDAQVIRARQETPRSDA